MKSDLQKLALHGGEPLRTAPMPARFALGPDEEKMMEEVLSYYRKQGLDPGYQGHFEEQYCADFINYLGQPGYADAVATGTCAVYVAIAALNLPKGSEVLVSPITDPGTLSAIIMNGLVPCLVDSAPNDFNVGSEQIKERITPNTRAMVLVHSFGQAANMDEIMPVIEHAGIKLVEDCSQSHGTKWNGRQVGTFGHIAAYSTMYRKAHITGASGGLVYTRDKELYHQALAHADRGKTPWVDGFDDRNPNQFLFPALNLHTDEISCAIGMSSLKRLNDVMTSRRAFVHAFATQLEQQSEICWPHHYSPGDSPFVFPVWVNSAKISCSKTEFAEAVRAEGIGLNPHYEYLVANWPYLKPYLSDDYDTVNARNALNKSFCLYLNEHYGAQEAKDCVKAILKVSHHYKK